MYLISLSNTLNLLVQQSNVFKSYHFGYHSDINQSVANNFDPDAATGKQFPLLLWAAPVQGGAKAKDQSGTLTLEVELYAYDLQGYGQDGEPSSETMLEAWNRLHAALFEMLHVVKKTVRWTLKEDEIQWFTDANVHVDRLLCVGATLKFSIPYGCDDYQGDTPLLVLESPGGDAVDLEKP